MSFDSLWIRRKIFTLSDPAVGLTRGLRPISLTTRTPHFVTRTPRTWRPPCDPGRTLTGSPMKPGQVTVFGLGNHRPWRKVQSGKQMR